ncbi:MAG: sortase [Candidatus Nomurabacteria bacterium]|jgi:sortase A|nr:sortase [Candidatus Nomurabacteria bacterium]
MDDEQKRRVEELARERVRAAFGQRPIDQQTADEVGKLLEHPDENSIFGKSEVLSGGLSADSVDISGSVEKSSTRMTDDVKEYHKAWQEYYRKYYEYHFGQELQKKDALHQQEIAKKQSEMQDLLAHEDKIDANARLMQRLRATIKSKTSAKVRKFRRSKHYLPIALGVVVFLGMLFIQYNRLLFSFVNDYITPVGNARGLEMIEADASGVSRLMIPKINVSVPIIYGCKLDEKSQSKCMRQGVMHFAISGANARPGQNGNFVLSGHSSNDALSSGDYKFIFAQLPKLVEGDLAYVNNEGVRYTYVVDEIKIVGPDDVEALRIGDDQPMMTLITCYPIGSARQRMLIFMKQIAPTVGDANPDDTSAAEEGETMVGVEPTLFEKLWAKITGGGL